MTVGDETIPEPEHGETDATTGPAGGDPASGSPRSGRPSAARIVVWLVVAGVGVYLIASGIVGMIAKG